MQIITSASVLIYNANNQVLIAKRSSNKKLDPGLWETLGGTLEFGENPQECIRREMQEELNCELKKLQLFKVYSYVNEELQKQIISIQFVATIDPNWEPLPNPEEIAKLRWVNAKDLESLEFSMNCKQRLEDYFNR